MTDEEKKEAIRKLKKEQDDLFKDKLNALESQDVYIDELARNEIEKLNLLSKLKSSKLIIRTSRRRIEQIQMQLIDLDELPF